MTDQTIVIIDDEQSILDALKQLFELEGYQVQVFSKANKALNKLNRRFNGVVLSDINMPELNGLELLEQVTQFDSELPVIFLTGYADVNLAVKAMHKGAYDLFEKPVTEKLIDCVARACEKRALVLENRDLKQSVKQHSLPGVRILGDTPAMKEMMQLLDAVLDTPADVLIEGETGTGKELVARYLHEHSQRAQHNFVALNCGAIPEELIESELFGAKSGAYTGATESRVGKFEYAHGGTVFLDEIEAMSSSLQVKLLRVLEERKVTPVGENTPIELDIRVIAATKVDLQHLVEQGVFRADLYYRLNLLKVPIPPLRARKADIPLLYKHFCSIAATRFHKTFEPLTAEQALLLSEQEWPGNVRELRNHAERTVLLGKTLALKDLAAKASTSSALSLQQRVSYFEQSLIEEALAQSQGSIKKAMEILNVPRKTLYDKMAKYGLSRTMFVEDK